MLNIRVAGSRFCRRNKLNDLLCASVFQKQLDVPKLDQSKQTKKLILHRITTSLWTSRA
jgi:hypothetical protein